MTYEKIKYYIEFWTSFSTSAFYYERILKQRSNNLKFLESIKHLKMPNRVWVEGRCDFNYEWLNGTDTTMIAISEEEDCCILVQNKKLEFIFEFEGNFQELQTITANSIVNYIGV